MNFFENLQPGEVLGISERGGGFPKTVEVDHFGKKIISFKYYFFLKSFCSTGKFLKKNKLRKNFKHYLGSYDQIKAFLGAGSLLKICNNIANIAK